MNEKIEQWEEEEKKIPRLKTIPDSHLKEEGEINRKYQSMIKAVWNEGKTEL